MVIIIRKLNVFIDETGDLGFSKKSSDLYGVSFAFHDSANLLNKHVTYLNTKLKKLGFNNMIHCALLIANRDEYHVFDIDTRKNIFKTLFNFSRKIDAKYKTIMTNKKYINNSKTLKDKLGIEIRQLVENNKSFFDKYDKITIYYDNGQESLGKILDKEFSIFNSYKHIIEFDHKKYKLFQVADMLTVIDKYDYKYKNKIQFSKAEKYFFSNDEIRKILKGLSKKRF